MEAVYAQTAITNPNVYRRTMSGRQIKTILEDVADNLFNPDPYQRQGGDMVRVGGLRYAIRIDAPIGQRLHDIEVGGQALDPNKNYVVAGWAATGEVDGPPVWDVVKRYIQDRKVIHMPNNSVVKNVL